MARNPKRRQPTSVSTTGELIAVIRDLQDDMAQLETAVVRGLQEGYRLEIRDDGPVIVDLVNKREARLDWTVT